MKINFSQSIVFTVYFSETVNKFILVFCMSVCLTNFRRLPEPYVPYVRNVINRPLQQAGHEKIGK